MLCYVYWSNMLCILFTGPLLFWKPDGGRTWLWCKCLIGIDNYSCVCPVYIFDHPWSPIYDILFQVHSGIAEVAAAKARMFINKPDGSKSVNYSNCFLYRTEVKCQLELHINNQKTKNKGQDHYVTWEFSWEQLATACDGTWDILIGMQFTNNYNF